MKTTDKILNNLALFLRPLHHYVKLVLLYIFKNHDLHVRSLIDATGTKMDLNLGNFVDFWIFIDGTYEGIWINQVKKMVRRKTFIDVGAHIGIYSLSLFREAKEIFAFEAEKKNYKRLLGHIKLNSAKNVKAYRKIVSDKGKVRNKLYINEDNQGMHSSTVSYKGRVEKVSSITLDSFINKHKIRNIGLIKIDVEGAELKVLDGLRKTLRKIHPAILLEFNPTLAKLSGHKLTDIYNLMIKNKYRAYKLINKKLVKFRIEDIPQVYNENVLFLFNNHDKTF
ncbi:hypothetical protein A2210_00555 [Candidatus Woesebacteria bacterium RIFOXYA1_FULL_40_18]|uniref:Methyltransferase FkbM domain-containing protein n=1 Tax=Candidatus Woesebacteria bacterium RIFOXYA1_FULL_40_18 TaxID=1802532 RepID=A0A1F8CMR4_9BACT|nr:MAG: hypothetical protein A2210_00555 [Candidatus Woesebacteria bacterium RIFOXYA1_FULL_40_18]